MKMRRYSRKKREKKKAGMIKIWSILLAMKIKDMRKSISFYEKQKQQPTLEEALEIQAEARSPVIIIKRGESHERDNRQ